MQEIAKAAVEKFDMLLRMVAPGFVAVLLLAAFDPDLATDRIYRVVGGDSWKVAALGAGIGFAAYALHLFLLEDLAGLVVVPFAFRLARRLPGTAQGMATANRGVVLARLALERWARLASPDKRVLALQQRLAFNYSWLIFVYCSSYTLVGCACYVWARGGPLFPGLNFLIAGGVCWGLACVRDTVVTTSELWLVAHFPQLADQFPDSPAA